MDQGQRARHTGNRLEILIENSQNDQEYACIERENIPTLAQDDGLG
jgi:hypothetical protein